MPYQEICICIKERQLKKKTINDHNAQKQCSCSDQMEQLYLKHNACSSGSGSISQKDRKS